MKRRLFIMMACILMITQSACYSRDYSARSNVLYGETKGPVQQTPAAGNQATPESGKVALAGSTNALESIIADHTKTKLDKIPLEWAKKAKNELHIAYGHTSHGSQITYGLMGLAFFKGEPFVFKKGAPKDSLDLRDNPFGGEKDLGNPDNKTWAEETRKYLKNNKDINVVMWSWCGQLSKGDDAFVKNYLDLMQGLEEEFPNVTFVYMTGHLDGTGRSGTLEKNNDKIREFCKANKKVLFDFADIESYNPDGEYFGDKYATDGCEYDSNGDKSPDKNWAIEWQNNHKKGKEWYECYAAHTQPINCNMKAYATWWMLARIAGWNGEPSSAALTDDKSYTFFAEKLQSVNLFRGTDKGFDLERVPTRLEGAAMLTRLLGGEKEAQDKLYSHPFKDAEKTWGNPYVGYLYNYSLAKGISDSKFGCDLSLDSRSYITFLLRALGYSDNSGEDFTWNNAIEAAKDFGMVSPNYYSVLKQGSFDRGHMAKLTYLSLSQKLKGKDITLLEKLVNDNVVDKSAAEQL